MPMTVVVTRNASGRMRGFLASCMLEIASGVYVNPRLSLAVRERVEQVIKSWFPAEREASIILIWADGARPEGVGTAIYGSPPYTIEDYDGILLSKLTCFNPNI